MTTFLRVLEAEDKDGALLTAIKNPGAEAGKRFEVDPSSFKSVPRSPFAYWVSERVRALFNAQPPFNSEGRTATVGLQSSDDFRFLRLWVETSGTISYAPFGKGGIFSPYYADVFLVVRWTNDGSEIKAYAETTPGSNHWSRNIRSADHYFRPGLTWPRRTNGLSLRIMPAGCIFADKGPAAFTEGDDAGNLLALCAIANSRAFALLVSLQLARTELAQSYEVGLIQSTPLPRFTDSDRDTLATFACRAWSLKRRLDTTNETSHAFLLPPGPNEAVTSLDRAALNHELDEIQREIDERAFQLYDIAAGDRAVLQVVQSSHTDAPDDNVADDDEQEEETVGAPADTLLSWFVGVAFGRFDPQLATRERPIPPEPNPFDPLPSRSPGMWPEGEEREVQPPTIMVDDPGHNHDIRSHVARAMAHTGWPDPADLRQWLAHEFFTLHIKMYSKSRRKAPIYWQLATPSASYSVWLYLHSLTRGTFYDVQNDYVAPKLAHEERKLESLRHEAGPSPNPAERKHISAQETFVEELRVMLDEVKRVAPLWNPNLDDGVVLVMAPLWRLVPQHKPWQKELKSKWTELCAGKYDWSHIAMHLWPERVVPKCADDRSLAIAHGLEDVFWIEGDDGKWKPRSIPSRPVEELVDKRASSAVKAALKSLLETPATSSGRGHGRRVDRGSADGGTS